MLALLGCGAAPNGKDTVDGRATPSDATMPTDVHIFETGPRSLTASYVGAPPGQPPCGSNPELVVLSESASEVRVLIREREPASSGDAADRPSPTASEITCLAIGHLWNLPASLGAPLADRAVLTVGGSPLPVAPGLSLAKVPDGYALVGLQKEGDWTSATYAGPQGHRLVLQRGPASSAYSFVPHERVGMFDLKGGQGELLRFDVSLIATWVLGGDRFSLQALQAETGAAFEQQVLQDLARAQAVADQ